MTNKTLAAFTPSSADYPGGVPFINASLIDGKVRMIMRSAGENGMHTQVEECFSIDDARAFLAEALAGLGESADVADHQVKHMTNRFLMWKIPESAMPDGGISINRHPLAPPVGTNLLNASEAEAMVRYMVEGMPKA